MNEREGMFDVSDKPDTQRLAKAHAIVKVAPGAILLVKEGKSPKGDIKEAAKIAAILAAKKTSELIPHCHPIPIDQIIVDVLLKRGSVEIIVEAKSVWKTGVEMEALTGASIGALTVYDMLKPIDNSLSIECVKLLNKSGGVKGFHEKSSRRVRAAVVVVSDSTAVGKRIDKSGKAIIDRLLKNGIEVVDYKLLSDDIELIEDHLRKYCDEIKVDFVLTTGGTGLGPRDVTPEATERVIEREVDGISETIRAHGQRRTPFSMLSRGMSGVRGKTVIINLPGSLRGVSESMDSLFPGILHAQKMLYGHGH
jgi:molybdenum cofactor biosynthesis protein MoaC